MKTYTKNLTLALLLSVVAIQHIAAERTDDYMSVNQTQMEKILGEDMDVPGDLDVDSAKPVREKTMTSSQETGSTMTTPTMPQETGTTVGTMSTMDTTGTKSLWESKVDEAAQRGQRFVTDTADRAKQLGYESTKSGWDKLRNWLWNWWYGTGTYRTPNGEISTTPSLYSTPTSTSTEAPMGELVKEKVTTKTVTTTEAP